MKTISVNCSFARLVRAGFLLGTLLAGLAAPPSAGPEAAGFAALQEQRFSDAQALFAQALESAKRDNDSYRAANMLFYLGLTQQRQARQSDERDRAKLLREAARYYENALELRTDFGAAMHNLAQVHAERGDLARALTVMKQALELPDARQRYYTETYADLLLRDGQWQEACRFYALASWAQPDNDRVHQKLVDTCIRFDRTLLGGYLWQMLEQGQALQAERHALDALGLSDLTEKYKEELMAVIATSLTRQHYAPKDFPGSMTAKVLRRHSADPLVGGGVLELFQLHEGEKLSPSNYTWWPGRATSMSDAPRGVWPQEAFQQLAISLGDRYRNSQETNLTESYYLLAAELNPDSPDPDALLRLAGLYAGTERLKSLADMMQQHEQAIFSAKGEAYRASALKRIYKFHTTLGAIYAYLNRYGNSGKVDSATFQLEQALSIAERSKTHAGQEVPIAVAAPVVSLLATTYEKTGLEQKAKSLRLDRAQMYIDQKDPTSAKTVLEPVLARPLPASWSTEDKRRLDLLKTAVQRPLDRSGTGTDRLNGSVVQLAPTAQAVDNHWNTETLTKGQRESLEWSVNELIRQAPTEAVGEKNQLYVLPKNAAPKEVKQVEIRGKQGRVLIEKNDQVLEVPFTVQQAPLQKATPELRYIRP